MDEKLIARIVTLMLFSLTTEVFFFDYKCEYFEIMGEQTCNLTEREQTGVPGEKPR